MKVIYNEGRAVGMSSYESYLRQILSVNPDANPLDERKWLSASLSANQSMILKIAAGTERGSHDYTLPSTSDLCGCSIIYATVFEGKCAVDESGVWGIRVDDYGRLISNTYELHPVTPGLPENVPTKPDPVSIDEEYLIRCREYLKLTGAIMLQPGEWITNIQDVELLDEYGTPIITEDEQGNEVLLVPYNEYDSYASFEPDLSKPGFVRIAVNEKIEHDLYIILTGFSYKTLAQGEVSYQHLDFAKRPEDGDYLGPATFPWGCKIILTLATDVVRILSGDIQDAVRVIEQQGDVQFWSGNSDEWSRMSPVEKEAFSYVAFTDQ